MSAITMSSYSHLLTVEVCAVSRPQAPSEGSTALYSRGEVIRALVTNQSSSHAAILEVFLGCCACNILL